MAAFSKCVCAVANKEQNAKVCNETNFDSSNAVRYMKIFPAKHCPRK